MIFQRSSEYIRYQGSLEDLRKIFEIGGPPGILERYLPTKIIRGCSEEQRVQRSSKDLWKIFEMKTRSSICGRSSRSKIFQKFSEVLRYRRSFRYRREFKDLRKISRSKINQGSSEKLPYQRSSEDVFLTQDATSEEQFCCPSDIGVC